MKLSAYDGKCVRITLKNGDVFTGECEWDSDEYCEAEYGRNEEALQIDDWLFYAGDIVRVEAADPDAPAVWLGRPEHRMRLDREPFRRMEAGQKTIELRLYDEKRRGIRVGDILRFEEAAEDGEVLRAVVQEICVFPTFAELYAALPLRECGYGEAELEKASPADMERYYPIEAQRRWGVVGIRLALV